MCCKVQCVSLLMYRLKGQMAGDSEAENKFYNGQWNGLVEKSYGLKMDASKPGVVLGSKDTALSFYVCLNMFSPCQILVNVNAKKSHYCWVCVLYPPPALWFFWMQFFWNHNFEFSKTSFYAVSSLLEMKPTITVSKPDNGVRAVNHLAVMGVESVVQTA